MSDSSDTLDGRYRVLHRLGSGGMGEVYRAERLRLGDSVAVKFIRGEIGGDPAAHERFLSEARAAASLRHPNIVSVIDFGVDAVRGPFLVMEYLNGLSLADEIRIAGPFPLDKACRILGDLASEIDLAHSVGIVHRDLKPSNVVTLRFANGESLYKIIDFGIAALLKQADAETATVSAPVMASLPYAAPEQLLGEVGEHVDVYGLGALAFEMLTGRAPLAAHDADASLALVFLAAPPRPSTLRPDLPTHVDDAISRALEKSPDRRWSSARGFVDALAGTSTPNVANVLPAREPRFHDRYELQDRIDTGRLGSEVYLATHRAIGVPVVVRLLRRTAGRSWEAARARFLREARAMQIAHPSILQVRDFGEEDDVIYVVTDRIGGQSLREVIDVEGRLDWARALRLTRDLLSATQAVHRRGGLIFGVNPAIARVYADGVEERLVISSAGIADVRDVLASAREDSLRALELPDTELLYVAPEVLLGEAPDGRTDVYSVGVLAYEMLAGRPPFTGATVPQLVAQIFSAALQDVREFSPDVPQVAAQAIARCLALRPDHRFSDVAELHVLWSAIA